MPATKTKARRRGQPLIMTKQFGREQVTYYKPGVVDMAREKGLDIEIMEHGKRRVLKPPHRKVHRTNLFAKFGDQHEHAGDGKYIGNGAVSPSGKEVRGAHLVNPFLAEEGSYHTIIAAFKHVMNQSQLRGMTARVRTSIEDGNHLKWSGHLTSDRAIAVSAWFTADQLWKIACKMNAGLVSQLRKSKSQRSSVKKHLSPRAKFDQNLDVMRRARTSFNPATGETAVKLKGGRTPYSLPLEQCGMAIDMCHLTDGFDKDGNEQGGYYYRLVIGRMTPWVLYRRHWNGLNPTFSFVYLNEKILSRAAHRLCKGKTN